MILLMALVTPVAARAETTEASMDAMVNGPYAFDDGDYATAAKLLKKAYNMHPDSFGINILGRIYYNGGKGITQDYNEAAKWFRLSAEDGFAEAQTKLGYMYIHSEGVVQDYNEAAKWFAQSAIQGDSYGQMALGNFYHSGKGGFLQDNIMAHMWFNVSAANNSEESGTFRDELTNNMTPVDISKAQAMARKCMSSDYKECGY